MKKSKLESKISRVDHASSLAFECSPPPRRRRHEVMRDKGASQDFLLKGAAAGRKEEQ